ncbi:MAG: hypothetical protein ACRD0I_11720 [Acidimicrobiales bacterium]
MTASDAVVLVLDSVDDLGEVSLDVGERKRLGHDLYSSHGPVLSLAMSIGLGQL